MHLVSRTPEQEFREITPASDRPPRLSIPGLLLVACLSAIPSASAQAPNYAQSLEQFRTGQYKDCVESTTKGITAEAWNENFRVLKIRAEFELGRYADALKTLDEGLERLPNSLQLRWIGRDVCRYAGRPERVPKLDEEFESLVRSQAWRFSDAANQVVIGRFLLAMRLDPKKVLDVYREIRKRQPALVEPLVAIGELALDKHDYAMAAESFAQAVKLDEGDPDAQLGLAKAFMPSEPEKSQAALEAALERNPNHLETLFVIVDEQVDSEAYDKADQTLRRIAIVNPHHPRAAAFRAVLAHLRNDLPGEQQHREAALKLWTTNPGVDHVIGRELSQKYRFAEGARSQRLALKFDPQYRPARMQLAQDLLRLGEEDEGWKLADEVYEEDGYNVVAHNLVTLHDSLSKFRTIEADGFVLRMDAREAEIYGRRVLDLLKRAKQKLAEKYEVTIDRPVIVEMFPRQQDFAIRTFGLPGGAGYLGVCFGSVITANSPASQGEHPSCWEATLWHEFCHVVTLHKTRNRMPRWLSEGISVYEERQENPTWGQAINPRYREMLLKDDLTPVSKLSGAFLSPPSPLHLQFAYFESSLVVEYLIETHGLDALKKVLVDLAGGLNINEALERHTNGLESLDAEFAKFAREQAETMAPQADWTEPELPTRASVEMLSSWLKEHPRNYTALRRLAVQLVSGKKWKAAKAPLQKMLELFPQDSGAENPYSLLARVHRELGESKQERAVLEQLAKLSADDVDMYARLTDFTSKAGEWERTRDYAVRWLAVNPLQPAPHRAAAAAAEALGDHSLAGESYRAILALEPIDLADVHLRLASVLQKAGDLPAAKRHALLALEEAPRFRAAHKLLLEIVHELEQNLPKTEPPMEWATPKN